MRTRKLFKTDKPTNLIHQDTSGIEIEFPDLQDNETPQKGDKILIDGKEGECGCCTLSDGIVIMWEKGIVTEVDHKPQPEKAENLKQTRKVTASVCRTFTAWKDSRKQKLEILGNNASTPFRIGNRVLVNGTALKIGKFELDGKTIKIINGRIAEAQASIVKPTGTRKVFKPTGKKMTGIPKPKATSEKKKEPLPGGEKAVWMNREKLK